DHMCKRANRQASRRLAKSKTQALAKGFAAATHLLKSRNAPRSSQIDMHASERASILAELTPPFTLLRPSEQLSPLVFCSPHSGRIYPKAFLEASRLDAHTLRESEDCYGDELFQPACCPWLTVRA